MTRLLVFAVALALGPSALAANPWDGTYKLNRSKSHLTGDSFKYYEVAGGKWHFSAGKVGYDFAPDGKPYPMYDADHTVITSRNGDHGLTIVEQFKGQTVATEKQTLSADGSTLTDETSGKHADGTSYTSVDTYKRSGTGSGFLGKWVSVKAETTDQEIYVISTAADGTVTMAFPAHKDSVTTKLDGTPATVHGPRIVDGVTARYKKVSPTRLEFAVEFKGEKISEGVDVLSADAKTLTETTWKTGEEDEKTISVYEKQ
jgi:hypothetical protein